MMDILRYLFAPILLVWSALATIFSTGEKIEVTKEAQKKTYAKEKTIDEKEIKTKQNVKNSKNSTSFENKMNPDYYLKNPFMNVVKNEKNWDKKMAKKKALSDKVQIPRGYGLKATEDRWNLLLKNKKWVDYKQKKGKNTTDPQKEIFDKTTKDRCSLFKNSIENFVGTVKIPVGIAGPVRINGAHANGDYYVPLATTEAALVASISRGISAINQAGGCMCAVIEEGTNRDPCICFHNIMEVGKFLCWAESKFKIFKYEAEKTTNHGKLTEIKYTVEGNRCHMRCCYYTSDASGQNMVTIATDNIVSYIKKNCPIKPKKVLLEGGMSGDKKANAYIKSHYRGRRVVCEVMIPDHICQTTLHATAKQLVDSANVGLSGLNLASSLSENCHFANPIAAIYLALGQDPACVAESHIGIGRCDLLEDGIYASVTLPNILCGTIGGGTKLPSQRALLELMGLFGPNNANKLAEVIAACCLAGELSLGAAVVSDDFAKAHNILARDTSIPIDLKKDTLDQAFVKAQAKLVKLTEMPSREDILKIYGLYKQSAVGDININKPTFLSTDLKAKAKFDAWFNCKGLSKEQAKKEYIDLVLKLTKSN